MSKATLLKGFFSKADEALGALKREKGTGAEFLRELEKTPGVKPQEIRDRKLDKVLPAMGKVTKADVQRALKQNPPPKIEETMSPKGQSIGTQDFRSWAIPGGENYREILLRLPDPAVERQNQLREFQAQMREKYKAGVNWGQFATPEERNYARSLADTSSLPNVYLSSHWDEPNILAHARVADRTGPNGERILHIEEIQSDWHQAGRQKGYKTPERMAEIEELRKAKIKAESELKEIQKRHDDAKRFSQSFDEKMAGSDFLDYPPERQAQIREAAKSWGEAWMDSVPQLMKARQAYESIPDVSRAAENLVPDAPFKKNWHELTMKRLLNYAAENGYDRVAITPGIEQAKRYDLSKHVNSVLLDNKGTLFAHTQSDGWKPIAEGVNEKNLAQYIGEAPANKLLSVEPSDVGARALHGVEMDVGGEGMKGFYDKILPDYLNSFGKPYGASVGRMNIPRPPSNSMDVSGMPLGDEYIQGRATWGEFLAANPDAASKFSTPLHTFDITPQMRQEIASKGLPLYQKIGVPTLEGVATGAGAATIGASSGPDNAQVPNKIQFSDSPDAMRLELMQRN